MSELVEIKLTKEEFYLLQAALETRIASTMETSDATVDARLEELAPCLLLRKRLKEALNLFHE